VGVGDTIGAGETSVFNGADASAATTGSLATGGTGAGLATGCVFATAPCTPAP
jgi:hypothetical protein